MTNKPHIAFLGIGLMGNHMARNILKAGYSLTAWNRTLSKAEKRWLVMVRRLPKRQPKRLKMPIL